MDKRRPIPPIFVAKSNVTDGYGNVKQCLDEHIDDKGLTVKFVRGHETRRAIQNRLAQSWKGEIAAYKNDDDLEAVWGEMKLQHLYPLKLVIPSMHDTAIQEYGLSQDLAKLLRNRVGFTSLEDYQRLCRAADICIRSKDVPLMLFARWLDRMQRMYEEHGLMLIARGEDERAMPTAAERKRMEKQHDNNDHSTSGATNPMPNNRTAR